MLNSKAFTEGVEGPGASPLFYRLHHVLKSYINMLSYEI